MHPILGTLVGVSIFVAGLVLDPILSALSSINGMNGQIDASFAYAALALAVAGLCILFTSATILTNQTTNDMSKSRTLIPSSNSGALATRHYARVLLLFAGVYAIFYSFASGIIVYDPNVSFSSVYHVSIPSSSVAMCCAPLGQTPLAVIYLTEHLGLLLVPANLFLLFSMSWLVGLNGALGTFLLSHRTNRKGLGWVGGTGAMLGLFTSCPTCAGLAVFSFLGGTGALSIALFLGPLQILLVAVSGPILVASPLFLAWSLRRNRVQACARTR